MPAAPRFHHDGWTPDVQTIFLETLMASGSVSEAARACGKTPAAAYKLRAHVNGTAFKAAWAQAIAVCTERVRDTALDRAFHGQLVPVFHKGEQVAEKRVFNDRLLIALMRLYDAPAYHAERAAAAQALIDPPVRKLSRDEMIVEFEAALEKVHQKNLARDAENAAFDREDAAAAALQAGAPGVSKDSPNADDGGGSARDGYAPDPIGGPIDDKPVLGVSKESPNGDARFDTGVWTAACRDTGTATAERGRAPQAAGPWVPRLRSG